MANNENQAENSEPEVEKPDYHIFNYEGSSYRTLFSKKFENRKPYAMKNPYQLHAFIPGTVMKVFVKEKHKVKKGEKLMVLQAMKMNNIIIAPFNAVIKKVNVKAGESVPKDHLLIELK